MKTHDILYSDLMDFMNYRDRLGYISVEELIEWIKKYTRHEIKFIERELYIDMVKHLKKESLSSLDLFEKWSKHLRCITLLAHQLKLFNLL